MLIARRVRSVRSFSPLLRAWSAERARGSAGRRRRHRTCASAAPCPTFLASISLDDRKRSTSVLRVRGHDARVLPLRRLVTVLQDAARGAARPRRGTSQEQGLGLAAVSYDSPEVLKKFAARRAITFPLLSDAGSATIKPYGLLNTTVEPDNRAFGVPFPGTFFRRSRRRVTSRFFENAYQERSTVTSMLARDGRVRSGAVTTLSTDHLDAHVWVRGQRARPGRRIVARRRQSSRGPACTSTPRARHGYQVDCARARSATWVRADEAGDVSTVGDLFLQPLERARPGLSEAVQAGPGHHVLDASPAAQKRSRRDDRLTLCGTLEYQACDDKICYSPQSMPVTWTVTLKPLDRWPPGSANRAIG